MKQPQIFVIHENDEWLPPLRAAFAAQNLPFAEWHMAGGRFDLTREPPNGIFYNRMSASAHTRGHASAPEYTAGVLAWLEGHGRRVVNGGRALDLEISKLRQYAALAAAGVRVPWTAAALGTDQALEIATGARYPLVIKPNRGGKGLGVTRCDDLAEVRALLEAPDFDLGPDGTILVQQYIAPARPFIIRNEYVDGELLYAVQVDTSHGFELCPADACDIDGRPLLVPDGPTFTVLPGFRDPVQQGHLRFLAANGVEVAGIEIVIDAEGTAWTYDVNTNTNYNGGAEQRAGLAGTGGAGMEAVAAFLGRELNRLYPAVAA